MTDMVAGLQAKLEGDATFSEQRYAALEANRDEQAKLREDRVRVIENYMHELAAYQATTTMEQMAEHSKQQAISFETRCDSVETHARELRDLTECSVDDRMKQTTDAVEVRLQDTTNALQADLHVSTTNLKAHVEQRFEDSSTQLEMRLEQRLEGGQMNMRAALALDM